MGDVSAVPSGLIAWARWASGLNSELQAMARRVDQAIEDLNNAAQSPRYIGPIEYAGNDMAAYAARNGVVDAWVGKVGQAFLQADQGGAHGVSPTPNQRVSVSAPALAKQVGDDPTKQADQAAQGARLGPSVK